jgi:hypothetical protein
VNHTRMYSLEACLYGLHALCVREDVLPSPSFARGRRLGRGAFLLCLTVQLDMNNIVAMGSR